MNKRRINWIKTLRERIGITQDDLATRLQVAGLEYTRGAINNWESERNQPPLHSAEFRQAFADALRVDVRTLLKMAGYEVDMGEHSILGEQVAYIVDNLPPDKQQLALALVEQLAKV